MTTRGSGPVLAAALLAGSAAQAGAPVDEIRALLREQALVAPDPALLSTLASDDLGDRLRAIDPWATWRAPDSRGNTAAGIGAEIYAEDGRVWLMPYADGPLMRAGFDDRVELRSVDGTPVAGRLGDAAALLAGDPGETRQIEVCTPACSVPTAVSLGLEVVRPGSVEVLRVAGRTLIRIRRFVASETRSFLDAVVVGQADGGLLLDLRDCQGGDLYEALDAAGRFLPDGAELAGLHGRDGQRRVYRAPPGWKVVTPLTIFISRHTASAGEVFAGILQAHGVAKLVGERTRGKCLSQTERMLSDGSVLTFTNFAVTLPGGIRCDGVGLTPDQVVDRQLVDRVARLLRAQGNAGDVSHQP